MIPVLLFKYNSNLFFPLCRSGVEKSAATNRLIKQIVAKNQITDSFTQMYGAKWTNEDLEKLSKMAPLKNYAISLHDRKFMAAFLKFFNDCQQKHIDLLYNQDEGGHVDLITRMKGLFRARFYCYA